MLSGGWDVGTVEAVEAVEEGTGRRFVLGVQWHAEQDGEDLRLFEALVAAAVAKKSKETRE